MAKTEDGGPAFPGPFSGSCGIENHAAPCDCSVPTGMSLRDYFAGQAMLGLISSSRFAVSTDHSELAYKLADMMISRRSNAT